MTSALPKQGRRKVREGEWGYGYATWVDVGWMDEDGNATSDEAAAAGFMASYEDADGHWLACREGGVER